MSSTILQPGFRLGKYEVLTHIATGGMGAVYKAVDLELRRNVALKVLPSHLNRGGPILERFRREARHAARLSHPNIVTLYECGYDPDQDLHYLSMEFIDGIDLDVHIQRKGPLPPEEARRILIQAARAMDHAFAQGVVHRDIKPSNFLLARAGNKVVVKLTDLGLACVADDDDFKVTREGTTVGTIDYLSPEQARDSRAADVRSDIYSLGCTAYHMLAGKAPFAEGGLGERVYKHMNMEPPDVRQFNPAVSAGFWAILKKMMAKQPEDRYATPVELLLALKRVPAVAGDEKPETTVLESKARRKTDFISDRPALAPTPELPTASPSADAPPTSKRRTHSPQPTAPEPAAASMVTPEQLRTAAAFHERAVQVLEEGGGEDYARELLGNCLKLDPFTSAYRQTLRDLNGKASSGALGRWFGSFNVMGIKSKMRAARANRDWRKVLEHGEDLLAHQSADVEAHVAMSEAAAELGLKEMAMWCLEQGREQLPEDVALIRAMARLFEKRQEWKPAIALWERVRRNEPDDPEARRMIDDLSVKAHLAKGRYRR